jgi:hypothetical protein
MERQTWKDPIQWIVVDDFEAPSEVPPFLKGNPVLCLRPKPFWKFGQNTLARNLLTAIPHVAHGRVLFIEDDDWYAPDYIAFMMGRLEHQDVVGETRAHYYHLPTRRGSILKNLFHASLCQTGIKSELLSTLKQICETPAGNFFDVRLWSNAIADEDVITDLVESTRCIGIKGLPGRPGIGVGHRPDLMREGWTKDADLSLLRSWIGDDVEAYREFLR